MDNQQQEFERELEAETAANELEIEVNREQILNTLFEALSGANIDVISMRNKSNRLEQLFLGLVDDRNSK